ncbi:penicillin-binding protein 1C [Maricaulis parjimensis]|uniref:penicillin-binding protein 1C n=1 Tax=Maricaulis parjimensis TaxID=144023 RepID=UPI001939FF4F|nr:penicillin-binding protein 1C [Maricaulis parjimensis]
MLGLHRIYWAGVLGLALLVGLLALDRQYPPPLEAALADVSTVVRDRNGRVLRAFPVSEGRWRLAADLDRIDPHFIDALLAYEDERFYRHAGVDPLALMRASRDSLLAGRIVSGGSTITMQLARLLEPRERTLGAKLFQIVRAVQLELRYSKREILEAYLTLAPYGGNLEGVRAASWAYFGREPEQLTIEETALLLALPQSPEARRPDLRPENARMARGRVLDRLAEVGLARAGASTDAALDPVPARSAFPADAWHAASDLAAARPDQHDIVSTLDIDLQRLLQDELALAAQETPPDVQFAAMIVETETRAVRALAGSASRGRPGGWIDLTDRPRSPGSTLKPFIYGMAFDDGLAAGGTRISDLPRRFAGYQPDNFDRRFRGDVTIAEALQHSLNVPAVTALDGVGARRFNAVLAFAGARPERPRSAGQDSGLAVALGGAGLTVRQIATLYAALGDEGVAQPLRWFDDEGPGEVHPVLSAESAGEILDILRRAPHPGGRMPAALARQAPDIAFKTGTSYGFRDAWSAGLAGNYTLVVWTGRADGAPREGVTGREGALPLLFRIADGIGRIDPEGMSGAEDRNALPETPETLVDFQADPAPHILFPPDGAEVWADRAGRGFVLSAQAEGELSWYADGEMVATNAMGEPVWVPSGPGFYSVTAVDPQGRQARSRVRILSDS